MTTLRMDDLADATDQWMDDAERRTKLFGWTDVQVARLWFALGLEMRERHVTLQHGLWDVS